MNTLLLIEDDHRLAHMVGEYLRQSGFDVQHAANGLAGLRLLQEADSQSPPISLVLLDLMLPDIDGLEVCRRIRGLPGHLAQTPVLMLTAKGDPMDRIVGLEIGADDYLPKPFEPRELLARIRAVLRRHGPNESAGGAPASAHQQLKFGSLELDRDARLVTVQGQACELTSYNLTCCGCWPNARGVCSPAIKSWRRFGAVNSKLLTAPSTCTWAASAPPLKTTPKPPNAS